MEKLTFQEEKDLDALLASYKEGYKPFPDNKTGIADYRRISFHGGLAICEDVEDRDDGDMNEFERRGKAIVPADAIRQQALITLREGRSTRTYQSINTVYSRDRRSESPGSPDERHEYDALGEATITMVATTMPPTLEISVDPAGTATARYVRKHGYDMNG